MDSGNNLLAHSTLPFYPNGLTSTVSSILSSSPAGQDTIGRSALSTQNGWSNYSSSDSSSLVPHNSCSSMSSYSNLQLGASFSAMNGKSPYNSFTSAGADYITNCRQMQGIHMNPLNMPAMRNYPLYGDMYQAAHPPGYTNGGFYPDMPPGIPPLPGRDIDCRSANSDSSNQGKRCVFPPSFCLLFSTLDLVPSLPK